MYVQTGQPYCKVVQFTAQLLHKSACFSLLTVCLVSDPFPGLFCCLCFVESVRAYRDDHSEQEGLPSGPKTMGVWNLQNIRGMFFYVRSVPPNSSTKAKS